MNGWMGVTNRIPGTPYLFDASGWAYRDPIMAGSARAVAAGLPYHLTQRGNRGQDTLFCDDDCRAYIYLMGEWPTNCGAEVWMHCLMPNHVHLIVVPESEESLRRAVGEADRRYTTMVNFRQRGRGRLWQGRFGSYVMDGR